MTLQTARKRIIEKLKEKRLLRFKEKVNNTKETREYYSLIIEKYPMINIIEEYVNHVKEKRNYARRFGKWLKDKYYDLEEQNSPKIKFGI